MPWDPTTPEEHAAVARFQELCRDKWDELKLGNLGHQELQMFAYGFFCACRFSQETAQKAARWCGHIKNYWRV